MDKLFKGWTDKTNAGSSRVMSRHPETGKKITHMVFEKDFRIQVDGKWHDAEWAAKAFLQKMKADQFAGKMGFAAAAEPLADLVEKYLDEKQNLAWKTLSHYRASLACFLKAIPSLENLNEDGLRAWKQKLIADGYSNNSIYGFLNDASVFCGWLVAGKKISASPFPRRKFKPGITPPRPRFWTTKEWLKFEWVIKGLDHHAYVGCRLAHDFGLRKIEIVGDAVERFSGVLWEDLIPRPDGKMDLLVREQVTKGGRKSRKLLLDAAFVNLLGSRTAGPIVPISRETFTNLFEKARLLSGINKELTFHGLRHSFGKDYMQSGGSLRELSVLLGHSSEEVTKIYAQFEQTHLDGKQEHLSEKRIRDQEFIKRAEGLARGKKVKMSELSGTEMYPDAPENGRSKSHIVVSK